MVAAQGNIALKKARDDRRYRRRTVGAVMLFICLSVTASYATFIALYPQLVERCARHDCQSVESSVVVLLGLQAVLTFVGLLGLGLLVRAKNAKGERRAERPILVIGGALFIVMAALIGLLVVPMLWHVP